MSATALVKHLTAQLGIPGLFTAVTTPARATRVVAAKTFILVDVLRCAFGALMKS